MVRPGWTDIIMQQILWAKQFRPEEKELCEVIVYSYKLMTISIYWQKFP